MPLVLSRHAGQAITIGDDVTITVKQVNGGRVHLEIEAPGQRILRGEIEPLTDEEIEDRREIQMKRQEHPFKSGSYRGIDQ